MTRKETYNSMKKEIIDELLDFAFDMHRMHEIGDEILTSMALEPSLILLMKNKRENLSYFIIFILFESLFILSVRLFSFPSILTSKYILIAIGNPTLATRVCKLESMVYKTKS